MEIFETVRQNKMVLKMKKSHINFEQVRVLGHILSKHGKGQDPNMIKTILNIARPTDLTGIQSICGLAQVSREYTHQLARILEPIQRLNRKNIDVISEWKEEHDEALDLLKTAITTAPILMLPDVTKKFIISVDACRIGRGIGAILIQENKNGAEQPVAYYSRSLTDAERNYSATDLEATALSDSLLIGRNIS
jgi:hypothetical protein